MRPFAELRRNNDFNNGFGFPFSGFRPRAVASPKAQSGTWQIPLDVVHQVNELVITASVPGINPADIKVNIDDGVLTIRAETPRVEVQGVEGQGDSPDAPEDQAKHAESEYLRRERQTGSFARSVKLPDTVDQDKVTSEYANGVLTIGLPKAEVTRPREITVKVA